MAEKEIGHFIGGKHVKGNSGHYFDVTNPNNNEVIAKLSIANSDELEIAIEIAKEAHNKWSVATPQYRARVFF